ncbi:hypothetical protein [Amycolatopsis orientalis]|uniref:hypothetical protein n=1 Tax=Amycolatopsis orientalis TaxID=31958 RepID=UPI0015888EAC|nr:hypothetical protein [Amycolatopsis orientalis]
MRALKVRSGLTLRQLEDRAAANGDVLARSTVADVLRRQTLPRPELVVAFVRACGERHRLPEWIQAYDRLIIGTTATDPIPAPAAAGDTTSPDPDSTHAAIRPPERKALRARNGARLLIIGAALTLVCAVVVSVLLVATPH